MPNELTTKEAAEKLSIAPRQVTRFIRRGELKAKKIGPIYIIQEDDLQVFLENWERRSPGRPKKQD